MIEVDELFGLPAHPLIVHIVVVLVPLAAALTALAAVRAAWRRRFGVPVAAVAVLAGLGTWLAIGSGEALEEHVEETELVERHAGQGDTLLPFVLLFVLSFLAVLLVDRLTGDAPPRIGWVRRWLAPALALLVVVGAAASTVSLARIGHSGAKAVWYDVDEESDE